MSSSRSSDLGDSVSQSIASICPLDLIYAVVTEMSLELVGPLHHAAADRAYIHALLVAGMRPHENVRDHLPAVDRIRHLVFLVLPAVPVTGDVGTQLASFGGETGVGAELSASLTIARKGTESQRSF